MENLWFPIVAIAVLVELAAILTKERHFPTLSRSTWRVLGLEDRSFDKNEKRIRILTTIVMALVAGWGILHIAWGPCAFNIC